MISQTKLKTMNTIPDNTFRVVIQFAKSEVRTEKLNFNI